MKYFFKQGCMISDYSSKVLVFQVIKKGAHMVLPLQILTVWTRMGMTEASMTWL